MTAPSTLPTDQEIEEARERLTRLLTMAIVVGGHPNDEDQEAHLGRGLIAFKDDLRLLLSRLSSVEGELAKSREVCSAHYDLEQHWNKEFHRSQSLLSLAMGALEPFDRHARNFIAEAPHTLVTSITVEVGELRQASQVIAQIKGGQGS